ncbi:MAG: hypothetical protein ABI597_12460 [Gammaproteobacteria bacterium]
MVLFACSIAYINCGCATNYDQSNTTQVGRYLTVKNTAKQSQLNLLSQTVQVHFPQDVQTVGEAMNYLLKFSGYTLVEGNQMNPALKITLSKPLPVVDREFGPVSLKDGLLVLAGSAFYLAQDPINRTVDCRLKSAFTKSYSSKSNKNSVYFKG